MSMPQENETMDEIMADYEHHGILTDYASESKLTRPLERLFSLVEQSLNDAITEGTGWAWKDSDSDSAIYIHDIVLSLRHMKHGLETPNANTLDPSLASVAGSKSDHSTYFIGLLTEVEKQDDFLAGIMRSYLEDALESIAEVRSLVAPETAPDPHLSKSIALKKLRNAVHCLAFQRSSLQFFAQTQPKKLHTVSRPMLGFHLPLQAEISGISKKETETPQVTRIVATDLQQEPVFELSPHLTHQRTDTTSSRAKVPRLAKLIKDHLIDSAFSKSSFLPQSDIDSLLSESNIRRELKKSKVERDPELVNFILNNAKKVFAILAYRGLVKYVTGLNTYAFTDDFLPVDEKSEEVTSLGGFLKDETALKWFQTWRHPKRKFVLSDFVDSEDSSEEDDPTYGTIDWDNIRIFCDTQWIVLGKVFRKGEIFQPVHDKCILPIVEYQEDIGIGGFSTLHKGRLHSAHHVGLITGDLIAIKQLKDEKSRAEKAYHVELNALEMVQKLDHERIVKFVAGFEQYSKRYLMFEWVDGGNLRDFWENQPWTRNRETIEWALDEAKGLAEALAAWHNWDPDPKSQRFCRHGDLKPENIVRDRSGGGRGKFLITDMGLAKTHTQPTPQRRTPSFGLPGTFRYQAPELNTLSPQISRSVDIWSFGCILLEFIIWLLYGYEYLHTFNSSLSGFSNAFYVFTGSEFRLHPIAKSWIDHMANTILPGDGASISGALGDMLRFVCRRMLIKDSERNNSLSSQPVADHEPSSSSQVPTIVVPTVDDAETAFGENSRAKVGEVCQALSNIVMKNNPKYVFDSTFPMNAEYSRGPRTTQLSLQQPSQNTTGLFRQRQHGHLSLDSGYGSGDLTSASTKHPYVTPDLSDTWDIYNDNQFANDVFRSFGQRDIVETVPAENMAASELCDNCSKKDGGVFFGRGFSTSFSDIQRNRHNCSLCRILAETPTSDTQLIYYRNGSSLATRKNGPPIWSLVVGPGIKNAPEDIQRGFPLLPESGGAVQAELIRKWVQNCSCESKRRICMPTRLIDLAIKSNPNDLNLNCSKDRLNERYAALSHRWGDPILHKSISLLTDNLEQWQRHINLSKLPQMFQDAVKITRQLGLRYLWIDTLCIVQDSDEDWNAECQNMEDVFSSAYITLSATCSAGVKEGFLKPNNVENFRRRYAYPFDAIGNNNERTRFYLCNAIDDFKSDVEESELSTRGWVFQERALSRRTVHFTKSQLYWECGEGIRSETLNRLFNPKSAFMSDPEFPTSMASQYKGMRIEFFKEIYRRYSGLKFTYETDRSLAMAGIERRLERVFDATASYGILNNPHDASYLRRSLLWRLSSFATTQKDEICIEYPVDRQVPTWSWMSVKGPIEYVLAPFGEMDWNLLEFHFDSNNRTSSILRGAIYRIDKHKNDEIFLDYLEPGSSPGLHGVLLGTERNNMKSELQKHYILLVAPLAGTVFRRIGVAKISREPAWKSNSGRSMVLIH